jgi:hypothetical protein
MYPAAIPLPVIRGRCGMFAKRLLLMFVSMLAVLVGFVGTAQAALPDGITTGLTAIQTDGLLLITAVTAVVIAFIGPGIMIKLVKRFSNKI